MAGSLGGFSLELLGPAGAFSHSETMIESQRQNAPRAWIRLACQFE